MVIIKNHEICKILDTKSVPRNETSQNELHFSGFFYRTSTLLTVKKTHISEVSFVFYKETNTEVE